MKFIKKEREVLYGYLTAIILLLVCYFLVFYAMNEEEKHIRLVKRTSQIIDSFRQLTSSIIDAESAFRGYAITRNEEFLKPYYESQQVVDSSLSYLKKSAMDPIRQNYLNLLEVKIESKYANIRSAIELVRKNSNSFTKDSLIKRSYYGKSLMDDIRMLVLKLEDYENKELHAKTEELNKVSISLRVINIATLVIALLLSMYSIAKYIRENKEKRAYRAQLEEGIENLKKTNQELIELKRMEQFAVTGRISRTIAHEVRNPLTNISLATEQLKAAAPETEDTSLLLELIQRNASRINGLVSELLNSTKFAQLDVRDAILENVLDQALELAKDTIELNGITVIKKYTRELCKVYVDSEKLKIALLNLIINAIEAMEPNKGVLQLITEQNKTRCFLHIKDNGIGMNQEALARIFEPYFTQKENGHGLGLTHTQNIILNHKGNIDVESQPGRGTTFTITLNRNEERLPQIG